MSEEKHDGPPPLYAQWVRADAPDATDERVARLWRAASESDRAFWVQHIDACNLLAKVASSKVRELYAVWIEIGQHKSRDGALAILNEALDGFDGPEWNGRETGMGWLTRTHGAGL